MKKFEVANLYYILSFCSIIFGIFYFRGFISWSDASSSWYSPIYNAYNLLFLWDTYDGTGSYGLNNFTSFFLRCFYSVGELINPNPDFIQKFSWICFFSIFGSIIIFDINKFLRNRFLSLILTLFLFFNPISVYFLWNKQHWTYYLLVPYFLGISSYIKYNESFNIKYLFHIVLIWFFFGFAFNQPAYFVPFIFILFYIFLYYLSVNKLNFKKIIFDNLLFALIFFLLNFVYLYGIIQGGTQIIDNQISYFSGGDNLDLIRQISNGNSFIDSFLNISHGANDIITNNLIILVIWAFFLVVIICLSISLKKDFKFKGLALTMLLSFFTFVFLLKGLNEPFSSLSHAIYNFKYFYIFRDYIDKFSIGYILPLTFMILFLLKAGNKIFRYMFITISVLSIIIFISNDWYKKEFKYGSTLSEYSEIKLGGNEEYRILNLPLVDFSFFHSRNPIEYSADNPLKNILKRDVIYSTQLGQNKPIKELKEFFYKTDHDLNWFKNELEQLNVKYILVNKLSYIKEDGELFSKYNNDFLYNSDFLYKLYDNKYYTVFLFNQKNSAIINSNNLTFQGVNPVQYNMNIRLNSGISKISLLQSFNLEWKLYLEPHYELNCTPIATYSGSINECAKRRVFYEGGEISKIWQKPIFDDTHKMVYEYANEWTIDPVYIKANYPKEYYKENPDGSIDVRMTLYFKPQSYFYLGLIISGITLIGLLGYFGYLGIYERRRKSLNLGKIETGNILE